MGRDEKREREREKMTKKRPDMGSNSPTSLRPQSPIDREGGVGLQTRVTPERQSEG